MSAEYERGYRDLVTVYWWTTEWCVTDRGFIKSEFVMTGR